MKTSSVNLSSVTTYRFGGLCKNFITIDNVDKFSKISEFPSLGELFWVKKVIKKIGRDTSINVGTICFQTLGTKGGMAVILIAKH